MQGKLYDTFLSVVPIQLQNQERHNGPVSLQQLLNRCVMHLKIFNTVFYITCLCKTCDPAGYDVMTFCKSLLDARQNLVALGHN